MSEISLNAAPSPELLKTAAAPGAGPSRPRADAGEAPAAPNPFAQLLSGVLGGTQPAAPATTPAAADSGLADMVEPPDATSAATTLLALPGAATPLPALADVPTGGTGTGNPLPPTGNILPTDLALDPKAGALSRPAGQEPVADPNALTADAGRPRASLADLALVRPLEPAPAPLTAALPAASVGEAVSTAAAAALNGRSLPAGGKLPDDGSAQAAYLSRFLGQDTAPGASPLPYGTSLQNASLTAGDLNLRLTGADLARLPGLPAAGAELAGSQAGALSGLLTAQLATFATSNDSGSGGLNSASATSGLSTTDAGSSALLSRLGSTTLPALQPLGDAGSFAGGLADRLLTVGGPGTHTARLKLHPEHLGELDVEISMDDGTAQVWFGTTTSQARDAIEGSLPRLKELFADQGIQLTRTQIDSGGGQMGNSGFGQERRMTGGAGAWNDVPAWQPGRAVGGAAPAVRAASAASARLLDVWA